MAWCGNSDWDERHQNQARDTIATPSAFMHKRFAALFFLAASLLFLSSSGAWQQSPKKLPLRIIVLASQIEAERVHKRLEQGEDFAALARTVSTDPSASDGGYLGQLEPATLRRELQDGLTGLTANQISRIIKLPSGYAILRVGEPAVSESSPTKRQALSAAGAVRLTYDYAGFAAAMQAVNKFSKPLDWNRNQKSVCEVRTQAIPWVMNQLEPALKQADPQPAFLRDVNSLLADLHSYRGDMKEAIAYWQASSKVAALASPERVPQFDESIGVAYLQRAGSGLYRNYVFPSTQIAPVSEQQADDLHHAAEYFLQYLKREPADGEVRWLLNLTYMLSGEYPAAVPAEYVIPAAVFQSKADVVHFTNAAPRAGLDRTGQAGGVIIDDFGNRGLLDVMISSVDDCEPLALYRSNGDGTFANRTVEAGLSGETGGLNIVQADYNNDGCVDVLILRGGWEYARPKSLLRNNCDGTFTNVTSGSGLDGMPTSTQTAVWADIDNDGKLDLFIGNENSPGQLFLNKGEGKFVEIGIAAGISHTGFTKAVAAADYDNDGFVDFYVSCLNGEHHLYHNNHDRTFTDVTEAAGVKGPWTTFGAWFFDYDNDGLPDLFVAGYGTSVEDVMRGYLGLPQGGEKLALFRNLGGGKFRDVTTEAGLARVFMPMGLNFGDIDNDGFLDFYLGSGNPSYASPIPNVLFHNEGGKRFTDITASSGTGILPKGHGIAFADLDNDGDEDIFAVMGGAVPGDRQASRLFENPGNGNDWLSLHLIGVKSNRSAIGARIKVTVRNEGHVARSIHRTVGSGGSFGASPLLQHVGLGKSAVIESVEIWWPATDTRQVFRSIAKNQSIEIQESKATVQVLNRPSFHFGGARKS